MPVLLADTKDIPALVTLVNSAYRGDASKEGWTTEAHLISGEVRTTPESLAELLEQPGALFLKYEDENKQLEGSVFLQKKENKLYLGMLSVSPRMQAKGIGKELLAAATEHARKNNCTAIFMRVISARQELIAWYERHGYYATGEKEPFPSDDRFGRPLQPIEFAILEKQIQ